MPKNSRKRVLIAAAFCAWLVAVAIGESMLLSYSETPGPPAAPPAEWPAGAAIRPESGRPVLLVFAHPHCVCSRATVAELAQIMNSAHDKVSAYVWFYAPHSEGPAWPRGVLWQAAEAIQGLDPLEDADGREALLFGASTSGQVLLYDGAGRLQFNGGITTSRGHQGPSAGRDAVESFLLAERPQEQNTPVFGCSILGAGAPAAR